MRGVPVTLSAGLAGPVGVADPAALTDRLEGRFGARGQLVTPWNLR